MSKQVFYVGIDVGAQDVWAAVAGKKPRKYSHTIKGIRALHRWASREAGHTRLHLCMEATGVYSQRVAMGLLEFSGTEISVVNPKCIKSFAEAQMRRSKTDQIDAEVIRCYAASQHPPAWRPASKVMRQLYALVAQAEALQATLLEWRNRHHAHTYTADLPSAVRKSQRAIERSLQRQIDTIETAITQLVTTDAVLAHQVILLESIPGMARKSATRLLAFGGQWLTNRTGRELVAHAGLAPHHHQSGTSVNGRSYIDKRGNRRLRKTLYMPALVGSKHNPVLAPFYQRLCKKGKPKKVALAACMKKLLLVCRSILINKKPFNANYQPLT